MTRRSARLLAVALILGIDVAAWILITRLA
jgi:hypothetical protein